MAFGTHPHSIGKISSLSAVRDAIYPALPVLCARNGMSEAELFVDLASDCIQLVVTDGRGRRFTHPRFITRQEIMDNRWKDDVEDKFVSTVEGRPTNKVAPAMPDTTFTLQELELAQDIVDSLK